MNEKLSLDRTAVSAAGDDAPELELSDEDILDAMRHIQGYLGISTEDFRAVYHLAHDHAVGRLFRDLSAGSLMRSGIVPLWPDTRLDEAASVLVEQACKSLPVVDADSCVIGIRTETDFPRCLKSSSFLQLLLRLAQDPSAFSHCCHESRVSEAMTEPAVTVRSDAGFRQIVGAFHAHERRSMPVVDGAGRLQGLLLRKDFVKSCHLEDLL